MPAPTRCWCTATARSTPTRPRQQLADIAHRLGPHRRGVRRRAAGRDAVLLDRRAPGSGTDVEKVARRPRWSASARRTCSVEGPIQYDAAIDAAVARTKLPDSAVAGRATVFVFPDLNTGNNTYKAVQRSAGALAVGPVLQGLRKPVNDLSRGATGARHRQHRRDHRDPGPAGCRAGELSRDRSCWWSTRARRR